MEDEPEVKDVETVHIDPAGDDEEIIKPETDADNEEKETPEASSAEKKPEEEDSNDGEEPEKEEIPQRQVNQTVKKDPKPVEGETPKEYALRKEVERLKGKVREARSKEVFTETPVQQPTVKPEKKAILEKYNPEELEQFKEIMGVVADDLGYVRKDEYQKTTFQTVADEVLNSFLDTHPEYAPENDKDDILWNRFKEELSLYKTPSNPKDYKRIFDRVHKDIFNIQQVDSSINKIKAGQEKIKVASHSSASSDKTPVRSKKEPTIDPSLKNHLKGFNDSELNEIFEE